MSAGFSYAQARIQARNGRRPDESTWARLDASKSLARYLESARGTGLEHWTSRFDARASAHEIESELRRALRAYIEETASWLPAGWNASVSALAELVELPLENKALADWKKRFEQRLPRMTRSERAALAELVELLSRHRLRMLSAERGEIEIDGWELRRALGKVVGKHFRRHLEEPSTVFAHLALVALDVERLRGALVERALFEEGRQEPWA